MKNKMTILNILLATTLAASAQVKPDARATFIVRDDSGKVVPNITVGMSTYDRMSPNGALDQSPVSTGVTAQTDGQGVVTLTCPSEIGKFGYGVRDTSGYYRNNGAPYTFRGPTNNQWQPWNPTIEIVVRPIVNPVAMYARPTREIFIPKTNRKYGYDLMIGDWVAPDGKGQTPDLMFEVTGHTTDYKDNDSTLMVSFANSLDGVQEFVAQNGSSFVSPREAPVDGYKDNLTFRQLRKPGMASSDWINDNQNPKNYFFRVRTVMDEKGNIKSALYGKIYGGFDFGGAVEHCYLKIGKSYLNPEPNSRNMEFDTSKNLLKGLKRGDVITAP